MKHVTCAQHPAGRLYCVGVDYRGPAGPESYRQETWSLDLAARWADRANPAAGWRLEYPYCGPPGQVQPKHPDFVGWVWDDKRGLFWLLPGQYEFTSSGNCPGETHDFVSNPPTATTGGFLSWRVMTFDPSARQWADVAGPGFVGSDVPWMSVRDETADVFIRIGHDGNSATWERFNPNTKAWDRGRYGKNAAGGQIVVSREQLALDVATRRVYAVDPVSGRLHRFSLASLGRVEDLGSVPGGPIRERNQLLLVWDSGSKVLLLLQPWRGGKLFAYSPDTGTWETIPVLTSPAGVLVAARVAVYDAANNVTLFFGGDPTPNPNLLLFRYAGAAPVGTGRP